MSRIQAVTRKIDASTAFRDEYKLGSARTRSTYNYHVPYHRFLSGSTTPACTSARAPSIPTPSPGARHRSSYHLWSDSRDRVHELPAIGHGPARHVPRPHALRPHDLRHVGRRRAPASPASTAPDYATGTSGTWSYFLNWRGPPDCTRTPNCAKGRPAGCSTPTTPDGGRRAQRRGSSVGGQAWSPSARPSPPSTTCTRPTITSRQVLTAIRPFGATPINGLLNDARDFFRDDADADYTTARARCDNDTGVGCFGPKYDGPRPAGCRKNYVILLTDGEPNLDLRPYCEGTTARTTTASARTRTSRSMIVSDLAQPVERQRPSRPSSSASPFRTSTPPACRRRSTAARSTAGAPARAPTRSTRTGSAAPR